MRYIALFDLVNYQRPIPNTRPQQYSHHRAWKHDPIDDLPATEVDRLTQLGAIAPMEQAAEAIAETAAAAGGLVAAGPDGDAELQALSAADLIAYVVQHPDERLRVAQLEAAGRNRVTVLKAAEDTAAGGSGAGVGLPAGVIAGLVDNE